jgi:hypothetical protein
MAGADVEAVTDVTSAARAPYSSYTVTSTACGRSGARRGRQHARLCRRTLCRVSPLEWSELYQTLL